MKPYIEAKTKYFENNRAITKYYLVDEKAKKTEKKLLQAMDRSRRAMNPQNYNEDGTIQTIDGIDE